jgi:hypothetical protein
VPNFARYIFSALKQILDDYLLKLPWNMLIIVSICCWMFWCIAGTIWMSFGSKIVNFTPHARRNSLLAKYFANSEILQTDAQKKSLLATSSDLANLILACWLNVGSVVHSEAFLSMFYNFITLKQHIGNAYNIK